MSEIKVTQMPEASNINDNDLFMIIQGGYNKKIPKELLGIPTKAHQVNVGTDTDYRVNLLKTKNLFDEKFQAGDIINQNPTLRLRNSTQYYIKAGTYTFSTNLSNTYDYGVQVQKIGKPPLSNYPAYIYTSDWTQNASTTFTINEAGWLTIGIRKHDNSALNVSDISSFNYMLEEGSTATEYAPFINNQINVDNEKYSDTINVGVTEDNRSRVNVLKSKNLINVNINDVQSGLWFSTDETSITQNTNGFYVVMPITAGSYTISRKNNNSVTGLYFAAFTTASNPANGVSIVDKGSQNGATIKQINITATSTAKYLIIYIIASVPSAVDNAKKTSAIEELQVEKGNEQTAYEPYVIPSIKVDDEEIYRKPKVLWENPNSGNDFASQTIQLNDSLANYDYYEIIYRRVTSGATYSSSGRGLANQRTKIDMVDNGVMFTRTVSAKDDTNKTMTFSDCSKFTTYGSSTSTTTNSAIVPVQIIGY